MHVDILRITFVGRESTTMFLVRSGSIQGYEKLCSELGCNPVSLLAQAGLSPAQLRDPDTYISYRAMAELMEHTARACDEPYFGLLLAQRQTSSMLGDMVMSVFQQPTLQGAIDNVSKYLYLHARGAHLQRETRCEATLLHLEVEVQTEAGMAQTMQMSIGQLANFVSEVLNLRRPSFSLLLRQSHPTRENSRLEPQLLDRIEFGAPVDGVRIATAWLGYRPHFDEAVVQKHFDDYLNNLRRRYPDNLQDQVRDIISQLLPSNECSVEKVAATLDLHPRVLQQRLQTQGASYGDLLRQTRREIAEQRLRYPATSITELAFRLGYAEVSVFSRSFKQWTGLSPRQWQQQNA